MLVAVDHPEVVNFRHLSDMETRIQSALAKTMDLQFTGQELKEVMTFFATRAIDED